MREEFVFSLITRTRDKLLKQAEQCPEQLRSTIPEGFNNSILWQMGHVLTVTDALVFGMSGHPIECPTTYRSFFGNGTKPADWTEAPPAWDTILEQLKAQPNRVQAVLSGKLSQGIAKENFMKAETIGELLAFHVMHESTHSGMVSGLLKALNRKP
ncbi:DinB family protein [Paenibacillus sp. OAS669]|uniref:DinB family protein n=1 Tax=Paenibacillus sp. OAS669 TaxID=2663821 RepID=UPI00178B12B7|nr:DinB family protein [Paenibacillus sp. OAS669]MBE1440742.1 putative damage-inducible protein DinB [Paenibacillus sp. OAS669]